MMKILVPSNFQNPTARALEYLEYIFPDALFELLHISGNTKDKSAYNRLDLLAVDEINGIDASDKKRLDMLLNTFPAIQGILFDKGDLENRILKYANSGDYNLLISTTHGIHSFQDILLGTTTQHLINDSLIPVISFPENFRINKSDKIVFNGSFEESDFYDLSELNAILESSKFELHLLKILGEQIESEEKSLEQMKNFCSNHQLNCSEYHTKQSRTIAEGLNQFLLEYETSLCIMATHARHGISHFFLGSITEDIINQINIPLLTFRMTE